MRSGAVRLAGRCLGMAVVSGVAASAGAQQMQTGLIASTGVSVENNPYNDTQSSTSAAVTAELQPLARFRSEKTTLDVRGVAQFRQFLRRYGLEDNYSANAALTARQSERLTLHASAFAAYDQGGYNGYGRPGFSPLIGTGAPTDFTTDPTTPDTGATAPVLPPVSLTDFSLADQQALLTDVTILGRRTRTKTFSGNAGFDARLSGRSNLSGDIGVRASRFNLAGLSDYNGANAELRYSRTLTELMSLGVIASVDRIDYRAGRSGDTTTKSVLLSFDRRFSARWALSVAAGGSFSDISQPAGFPDIHLTSFTVRGQFCRATEYSQLCVSASRSPQPSAAGGVRVSDTYGASYSRRLSGRETLSLAGNYARTGRGRGATSFALPAVDFISGTARYDNQIRERASLYVSGSVSKYAGAGPSRSANLGLAAGIQFRFGAL